MSDSAGPNQEARRVAPTERREIQRVRRQRPGDEVVRVRRARLEGFSRKGAGRLEATAALEEPHGLAGVLKRWLVGAPIHSELEIHE